MFNPKKDNHGVHQVRTTINNSGVRFRKMYINRYPNQYTIKVQIGSRFDESHDLVLQLNKMGFDTRVANSNQEGKDNLINLFVSVPLEPVDGEI
jgi:hypothetical protein